MLSVPNKPIMLSVIMLNVAAPQIHYFTHYYTLLHTFTHYYTLLHTILHYYTLLHTILHTIHAIFFLPQDRVSWALPRGSPYLEIFSYHLSKLRETGHVHRLINPYVLEESESRDKRNKIFLSRILAKISWWVLTREAVHP